MVTDDFLRAHARPGITPFVAAALGIFAQRELHRARRACQLQVLGQAAPSQLDDHVLAADRVGRAVLDHRRGQAAGELPVHCDVVECDHVAHVDLGDDRGSGLIHVAHAGVDVRIDQAGGHVFPRAINHDGSGRRAEPLPHLGDLASADQDIGTFHATLRPLRPDRRVANEDCRGLLRRRGHAEVHRRPDERQVELGHVDGCCTDRRVSLERSGARTTE
jgi:hypothetical protein